MGNRLAAGFHQGVQWGVGHPTYHQGEEGNTDWSEVNLNTI